MRWQDYRRSDNVEEGSSSGPSMFGGGLRLSGGAIILVVVVSLLLGKNPLEMLALLTGDGGGPVVQTQAPQTATRAPAGNDPQTEFVARVLGDTEDVWGRIFQQMGTRYQAPKLTLYHGQIASACGFSSAAAGPFYCPGDRKVYLDLSFFQELSQRFGAPGDFARAYVIAHEIGHHVQNQLGLMDAAQQRMASSSDRSRNDMSVRLELQADCLAGV
jgi:predicted metalloprotease